MDPSEIPVRGPLALYREPFWAALAAQGYTPLSSCNQLRLLAHLSRWLDDRRLKPEDLDGARVEQFLRHRRRLRRTCWLSLRGMEPILRHLRGAGVVPAAKPTSASPTPFDVLLHEYEDYLLEERALEPVTARGYLRTVRDFLSTRPNAQEDPGELRASDVTAFILRSARSGSIGSAKLKVTGLRSFLRHLHVRGDLLVDLTGAVPAVAGWRLAGLPKGITDDEVRRLLRSCDRRTHVGKRDFAAILLMVRLGLRAGEVAGLRLDDLDWAQGELVGSRQAAAGGPAAVAARCRRGDCGVSQDRSPKIRVPPSLRPRAGTSRAALSHSGGRLGDVGGQACRASRCQSPPSPAHRCDADA